jgi:outer membrane protein OmpA-like peptidoglycan-associated protein
MPDDCHVIFHGGAIGKAPLVDTSLPCDEEVEDSDELEVAIDDLIHGSSCGGCSAAHGSSPLWLIPLVYLLRALLFCLPVQALAVDAESWETRDGGLDGPVISGELGTPWTARLATGLSWGTQPAVMQSATDGTRVLIENLVTHDLGGSFQLGRVTRIGFQLPIHYGLRFDGSDIGSPVGAPSMWGQIPLASGEQTGVAATFTVQVHLADPGLFPLLLSSQGAVDAVGAARWKAGLLTTSGHVGIRVQQQTTVGTTSYSEQLPWALSARLTRWTFAQPMVGAFGTLPLGKGITRASWPTELHAGVATEDEQSGLGARLSFGTGLGIGLGNPKTRLALTVFIHPPRQADRDGDGINNLLDLCADKPEDKDKYRDWDGCPEADNDQDGFLDEDDTCPNRPESFNEYNDDDGCPDELATVIATVQGGDELVELHIGPEQATLVPGDRQKVVVMPGEQTVTVASEGYEPWVRKITFEEGRQDIEIELVPIRYGELVLWVTDPNGAAVPEVTAEVSGDAVVLGEATKLRAGTHDARASAPGFVTSNQLVRMLPATLTEANIVLHPAQIWADGDDLKTGEEVHFDTDDHTLTEAGSQVVEALAAWLNTHPEVLLLRVAGHADQWGGSAYNYELSQNRAGAIVDQLVNLGIEPTRLDPVGWGEALLEGDDTTSRRATFTVLVWDDAVPAPVAPEAEELGEGE